MKRGAFGRGLAVSVAGLRAGGAFAIDGALQRLRGDGGGDSPFMKREAKRFVAELGRLKGTYVKIGQMLALLGEHFLPPVLTDYNTLAETNRVVRSRDRLKLPFDIDITVDLADQVYTAASMIDAIWGGQFRIYDREQGVAMTGSRIDFSYK